MCADLSYKEATWELAQDLEDEVIADLFRCATDLPAVTPDLLGSTE